MFLKSIRIKMGCAYSNQMIITENNKFIYVTSKGNPGKFFEHKLKFDCCSCCLFPEILYASTTFKHKEGFFIYELFGRDVEEPLNKHTCLVDYCICGRPPFKKLIEGKEVCIHEWSIFKESHTCKSCGFSEFHSCNCRICLFKHLNTKLDGSQHKCEICKETSRHSFKPKDKIHYCPDCKFTEEHKCECDLCGMTHEWGILGSGHYCRRCDFTRSHDFQWTEGCIDGKRIQASICKVCSAIKNSCFGCKKIASILLSGGSSCHLVCYSCLSSSMITGLIEIRKLKEAKRIVEVES
jgi:hypothetical protein